MRPLPTALPLLRFIIPIALPVVLLGFAVSGRPAVAASASAAVRLEAGLAQPVMLAGHKNVAHLRISLFGQQAPAPAPAPRSTSASHIYRRDRCRAKRSSPRASAPRRRWPSCATATSPRSSHTTASSRSSSRRTQASDRAAIAGRHRRLQPGGSTALFAGVVKCAGEVRKFSKNRVNRIILLSDGLANVGPSSPAQLGALGASRRPRISVTTIGLGPATTRT